MPEPRALSRRAFEYVGNTLERQQRGYCADNACQCHNTAEHRVMTPFPGPMPYCCTLCARVVMEETPEQILNRLAARLNCEPRQVADRVIRMLEDRKRGD